MERISRKELPQGLIAAMEKTEDYVNHCGLDLMLLELLRYRVSQINNCKYCMYMHYKKAEKMGETIKRLQSISNWRDVSEYSDKEKAVLAFSEMLTSVSAPGFDTDVYDKLAGYFTKKEIAKWALSITQINSWNRLMICFGLSFKHKDVNSVTI